METDRTSLKQVDATTLDCKEGNNLDRIRYEDNSILYVITEKGGDVRIEATDLKKAMKHWQTIHTTMHNEWRNGHFKLIIKKDKAMSTAENDKQTNMFDGEPEE